MILRNRYNIKGSVLKWIENWLKSRKQRVILNGVSSDWLPITSSVIQGSVLGVVLALLLLDSIDSVVRHCFLYKYADDNKLGMTIRSRNDVEKFQDDLNRVTKWTTSRKLRLNADKCSVISFGNPKLPVSDLKLSIGGTELKIITKEKDLGIIVDDNLSFSDHAQNQASKAMKALNHLKRNIITRKMNIWINLYKVYVRPIFEYGLLSATPNLMSDMKTLERVQRHATKQVSGIGNLEWSERNRICGLLSIKDRIDRQTAVETYKIINGLSLPSNDLIEMAVHTKSTRATTNENLVHSLPKMRICNTTFRCRAPKIWNSIWPSTRKSKTTSSFRIRYDEQFKNAS